MNLDGIWQVNYASEQTPTFTETGDADQSATITLQNGLATGKDPWGGQYTGNYWLENNVVNATVIVSAHEADSEPIFDGLDYPFSLELVGEINSPEYFSMVGHVISKPSHKIVLNFRRQRST